MSVGGQSSPSQTYLLNDSAFIIAEFANGCRWSRNLEPNCCPGRDLITQPLGGQPSIITTEQISPFITPTLSVLERKHQLGQFGHSSKSSIMSHCIIQCH